MHKMVAGFTLCLAFVAQPGIALDAAPPSFEAAFERHVQAVQARDMVALEPTLTRGEALTLILPNGIHTSTRAEYLDFHERFFATSGWTIAFDPVSTLVAEDFAIVTTRSTYESTGEEGVSRSHSWVTFVFRYEDDAWRLVHDQNTRIPAQ